MGNLAGPVTVRLHLGLVGEQVDVRSLRLVDGVDDMLYSAK